MVTFEIDLNVVEPEMMWQYTCDGFLQEFCTLSGHSSLTEFALYICGSTPRDHPAAASLSSRY